MTVSHVDEVLDYAIDREQEAHDYYIELARRAERPGLDVLFTQFAGEELAHRRKLESIKAGRRIPDASKRVMDLKLAEYVVDVDDQNPQLSLQDALILAMKREKASFRLYTDLANAMDDETLKDFFLGLAQEEARHKLRFELEYDDVILAEN